MIDYAKQPSEWMWGPYFSVKEFTCKGSGECLMDPFFMDKLVGIRKEYNAPMIVSSGYRSPAYNAQVAATGESGPHTTGRAVDIIVDRGNAYRLLSIALMRGMTGIGINQKGEGRFIHFDDLDAPAYPRPTIWSY